MVERNTRYTERDRDMFSERANVLAPKLLGKILCRRLSGGTVRRICVTEVEAYLHGEDVCYGTKGKASPAVAPLLERGGTCCVYAGMLLISCGKKGQTDNVLIRRGGDPEHYCGGPMGICDYLGIGKDLHGADLLTSRDIWLEEDPSFASCCRVERLRLKYSADEEEKKAKYRFIKL